MTHPVHHCGVSRVLKGGRAVTLAGYRRGGYQRMTERVEGAVYMEAVRYWSRLEYRHPSTVLSKAILATF